MKVQKMSDNSFVDDDVATAPRVSGDPGGDFLDHVPFEALYQRLIAHACSTVELAGGHHGKSAVSAVLRSLPRWDEPKGHDLEVFEQRLEDGDLSVIEDMSEAFDWQEIASDFFGLFHFARHGDTRFSNPEEARPRIESLLRQFRRLVADPGVHAIVDADFLWFSDTLAAAEARWEIDNGRPVSSDTLAALAGVKPKTLANLLAAGQLKADVNGRVSAAEALQYLGRRKRFVPSVWQVAADLPPQPPEGSETPLPAQVFVPVDGDGSPFLPSLARRGRDGQSRYTIGEKASPIYVENYWEALSRLAEMPIPRWRRPASGAGGWSLVSGQEGWRRFARLDIQRMIDAIPPQQLTGDGS